MQALGLDTVGPSDEVFNDIRLVCEMLVPADHNLASSAYGEALNQLR